jgi:hypothetical protein
MVAACHQLAAMPQPTHNRVGTKERETTHITNHYLLTGLRLVSACTITNSEPSRIWCIVCFTVATRLLIRTRVVLVEVLVGEIASTRCIPTAPMTAAPAVGRTAQATTEAPQPTTETTAITTRPGQARITVLNDRAISIRTVLEGETHLADFKDAAIPVKSVVHA